MSTRRAMQAFEAYVKETDWGQAVASQHFKAYQHKQRTASASQTAGLHPRSSASKQAQHIQREEPKWGRQYTDSAEPQPDQPPAARLQLAASSPIRSHCGWAAQHKAHPGGSAGLGHAGHPQRSRRSRQDNQLIAPQEQASMAKPDQTAAKQPGLAGTGAQSGDWVNSREVDGGLQEEASEANDEQGSQMDAATSDDDLASSLQHGTLADKREPGGQPISPPPPPSAPVAGDIVGFVKIQVGKCGWVQRICLLKFGPLLSNAYELPPYNCTRAKKDARPFGTDLPFDRGAR